MVKSDDVISGWPTVVIIIIGETVAMIWAVAAMQDYLEMLDQFAKFPQVSLL